MTDEAEWLEWRRAGIGASDVAAAVTGLYGGRVGVVAAKLGIGQDDIAPAIADRGHRWEQPIADVILDTHGLYALGEQTLCEHPTDRRWRCTLEGFLHDEPEASTDDLDTAFEVKTRSVHVPARWEYYRFQGQWQMHVTGVSRVLLVVATIDDADDSLKRIEFEWVDRDEFVAAQLVAEAEDLWRHVEAGRLPEPTDGSTLAIIRAANARADDAATADLDPIAPVVAAYDDLKARVTAARDELKLQESRIRSAMGEATEATTSDGRWRVRVGQPISKFTKDSEADALSAHPTYTKAVLDRDLFKVERPDDYEALKRPTADRRMTIKEMFTDD